MYQLEMKFYEDDNTLMIYAGWVLFTIFMLFNVAAVLLPFTERTIKFFKKPMPPADTHHTILSEEMDLVTK